MMKTATLAMVIGTMMLSQQGYSANTDLDKTVIKSRDEVTPDIKFIDAITIDQTGINSVTDIVRHIPGVQVNDTGDRFNANGFNIRGLEGDSVAISIDGLAQGETLSPPSFAPYGMFGSNRSIVDTETVKEIVIVKGPNSVLAGSGALGGSVALTTKSPSDFLDEALENTTGGKLKLGYDERKKESLLSGAIANRTGNVESLFMVAQREGSESQSHSNGGPALGAAREQADPYDRESISILAKLIYNISDNQRIGFVYEDTDRDTEGKPLSRDSLAYYNFFTEDTSERERIGLFYELDADTFAFDKLSINLDKQDIYNSGITAFSYDSDAFGPAPNRSNDILRTEDRSFRQETVDLGLDLEKTLGANDQHTLVYGVAYRATEGSNKLFDRRFATVNPNSAITQNTADPSWVPETDKSLLSVYGLDKYTFNDVVSLSVGARYESTQYEPKVDANFTDPLGFAVKDAEFTSLVGQLGVDFKVSEHQTIGVLFAQGYKAPTTQELYLGVDVVQDGYLDALTGQTFDDWEEITNPDLEPEEANSIEFSYIWDSKKAFVKVNTFVTDYTNRIQSVSRARSFGQTIEIVQPCIPRFGCDPANPPPNLVLTEDAYNQADNVGEVRMKGIEIESMFVLSDAFALAFSASHVEGEHDTAAAGSFNVGDELSTVAPDSATLSLHYKAANEQWGAKSTLVWTDAREDSNDLSITSLNNGGGPATFTHTATVLDLSAHYNISDHFKVTANIHNVTDKDYTRWEVINSVRPGTGGFFSGASGDGVNRFSEPGRSLSVYAAYSF